MEMGQRIFAARKKTGLNQADFGKRIGVTRSAICNYENGSRSVGEQVIISICREFNVNETWLRTGEGEMFVQLPKNEVLEQQIREFLSGGNDSFRERLISLLLRLPPEQWETLEHYAQELVSSRTAPASAPAHTLTIEEEARAEAEEYYREILEEKKQAANGSASSGSFGSGEKMA